ncbi:MAG: pyridoxamine 5'-phosphate oxidase family protein [Acetobacteraceae bacterium]|nr:pyridoxamine 5'-phosphate oxidase family protein [Acetobacteraceae bacterium]
MGGTQVTQTSKPGPAHAARMLLRASRAGTLATSDAGQPFASLITPATAADGSVLMLLSGLSPHTRHLRAEPRCAILVIGPAAGPNPQTSPRLTLVGSAAPVPDTALKARWVALHPYAAFYAELGDFQLWRFRAVSGQFVGGFASAHRLRGVELHADPEATAAIEASERGILEQCNAGDPARMDRLAAAHGGAGEGWRMVACDPDGCHLARVDQVLRIAWPAPVSDAGMVQQHLFDLARAAWNPVAPGAGPGV